MHKYMGFSNTARTMQASVGSQLMHTPSCIFWLGYKLFGQVLGDRALHNRAVRILSFLHVTYKEPSGEVLGMVHSEVSSVLALTPEGLCRELQKVLKEISVGQLNPNETVQANLEAQLLSKLDHPTIVKFHASFVEQDNFCIITEYCEKASLESCWMEMKTESGKIYTVIPCYTWGIGSRTLCMYPNQLILKFHSRPCRILIYIDKGRDLDCKIQEYKEAGKIFPENQIIEWFIQLLLGVDYMHERRILHRDLKSKNIFLKSNLLKIGDFGVSRLLMGSCDLATTLTGTPHYMSPEALKHQGYDTKSDIWSLACILYEMCCMNHAFTGSSFLSIVLKIVEGDTPSLPERYPRELNAIMESMLNKSPSLRPSALEILKIPYIDEQLQHLMCRYSEMTLEDKNLNCQKESAHIINAMQKKIHLHTLRVLSEVQKMTPRERMRLRKLQAADEKARKLKKIVEEKYEENNKRMQELRSRNFQQLSVDVLHEFDEPTSENLPKSQPVPFLNLSELESSVEDTTADLGHHEIPEDPLVAEEYYADVFDSCTEESEEEEEEIVFSASEGEVKDGGPQPPYRTNQQTESTVSGLAAQHGSIQASVPTHSEQLSATGNIRHFCSYGTVYVYVDNCQAFSGPAIGSHNSPPA
nr:serine/threonine-protein kinase Nek11 isoform X4 [Microcebus murinus]